MKKVLSICLLILQVLWVQASQSPPVQQWLQNPGVSFRQNMGQVMDVDGKPRPDVLYTAQVNGVHLFFQQNRLSYVFPKVENGTADRSGQGKPVVSELYRMDLELLGANPNAQVQALDVATEAGVANFYLAHAPAGITGVQSYRKIVYKNIYNQIDLVFHTGSANGRSGVKYDFVVHPGGNVADIRLRYTGANSVLRNAQGGLEVANPLGRLSEQAPITFQVDNPEQYATASTASVTSQYVVRGQNEIGFQVGPYNAARPLVIDPLTLTWATFLGGTGNDDLNDFTLDPRDNSVVATGASASINFPTTTGSFQPARSNPNDRGDAFVVKWSTAGARQWCTYYGGTELDEGRAIATNRTNGNIAVAGFTNSLNMPVLNPAQAAYAGGRNDAMILVFSPTGARQWATFYGGRTGGFGADEGTDEALGVAFSPAGDVYVTGITHCEDFPTESGGGAVNFDYQGDYDMFLLRFTSAGARLWATYYGGELNDRGEDIQFDADGNFYVTGWTFSSDFRVSNAFQPNCASCASGASDAFVMKFSSANSLTWASFFGGSGTEFGFAMVPAADGSALYYVGSTTSTNNIASGITGTGAGQVLQGTYAGGSSDGYVLRVNANGQRVWSSYVGGANTDELRDVAIDGQANVHIIGNTNSTALSTLFPLSPSGGGFAGGTRDVMYARINADGNRLFYRTFYGGSGEDLAFGLAVDNLGAAYFAGRSTSPAIPLAAPTLQNTNAGTVDNFYAKLTCVEPVVTITNEAALQDVCRSEGRVPINYTVTPPLGSGNVFTITAPPGLTNVLGGSGTPADPYVFIPDQAPVGGGVVTLNVSYLDACPINRTLNINVINVPALEVTGIPAPPVCSDANPFTLNVRVVGTGAPVTGTWTGRGITAGGLFTPSQASDSANGNTVRFTGTLNNCPVTIIQVIRVTRVPAFNISGLNAQYCETLTNSIPISITPAIPGATVVFTGNGVTGNVYIPSRANVNPNAEDVDTVRATVTLNGCRRTALFIVRIGRPEAATVGIAGGLTTFCSDDTRSYSIVVTPPSTSQNNGSLLPAPQGVNATAFTFTPSNARIGSTTIVYQGTSANTCPFTASSNVTVTQAPRVTLGGYTTTLYCVTNTTPVVITASQPNGAFTINGAPLAGGRFVASNFTPNTYEICYAGTVGACSYRVCTTFTVVGESSVQIAGVVAGQTFCSSDNGSYPLSITGATGATNVVFTGSPAGSVSGSAFRPRGINGQATIRVTGNAGGCPFDVSVLVNVNQPVPTTIAGLTSPYCSSDCNPIVLTSNPTGAVITGQGVELQGSVYVFVPCRSGVAGVKTLTATPGAGVCASAGTTTVTVTARPRPTLTPSAPGPFCVTQTTPVNLSATNPGPPAGSWRGPGVQPGTTQFIPRDAGPGDQRLCYSGTISGCTFDTCITLRVTPEPTPTISGVAPGQTYCATDNNAITLTGTPPGGTFSGPGVSGNRFTPSSGGTGERCITYAGTLDGCQYTTRVCVNVNPQLTTTVGITGTSPFCDNDTQGYGITLSDANNAPVPATFSITPATAGLSGSTFTPSVAGAGSYTITGTPQAGQCARNATLSVVVSRRPTATITGVTPNAQICSTPSRALTLTGSPAGGSFTINGTAVTGTTTISPRVDASPLVVGGNTVVYRGRTAQGCDFETTLNFTITEAPVVTITTDRPGPYCNNSTQSIILTPSISGGTFSANNGVTGNSFNPRGLSGPITITYTLIANTCTSTARLVVNVQAPVQVRASITPAGPFCITDNNRYPVTITPDTLSGRVRFDGCAGFSQVGNTWGFVPSAVSAPGTVNCNITPADGACLLGTTLNVVVAAVPTATISGVREGQVFCVTQTTPVNLTGTPSGGTFSGDARSTGPGTGTFTPSVAGVGSRTITYSGTQNGCAYTTTITVQVNERPTVTITTDREGPYCVTSRTPVILTGNPAGCTFSGPGTSGGSFIPANAGVGNHTITYSCNQNGCTFSGTIILTVVNERATTVAVSGSSPFCTDDTQGYPIRVTGVTDGEFTLSGPGVLGNEFRPFGLTGNITITLTPNSGVCARPSTTQVVVNPVPTATIAISGGRSPFCVTDSRAYALILTPAQGTNRVTGPGANPAGTGFSFTPSLAGVGTHTLTLEGRLNGCTYRTTLEVVVNERPTVTITTDREGPYCVTDRNPVTLTGSPAGGTFSGNGTGGPSGVGTFTPSSAGVGTHTITYAGNIDGCNFSGTRTLTVVNERATTVAVNSTSPFCTNDSRCYPINVTGINTSEFTLSGNGVNGDQFCPLGLDGTITITVTPNAGVCARGSSTQVQVSPVPNATITLSAGNGPFCVTDTRAIGIIVTPAGGNNTLSGPGVSRRGNGFVFIPSETRVPGRYTINLTGNLAGCDYTATLEVEVSEVPTVTINTIPLGPFCSTDCNPVSLVASPDGGNFSGPGVSGTNFTPCNAGAGNHTITYSGNQGGCRFSGTTTVRVGAPVQAVINNLADQYCVTDNTPYQLTATPAGSPERGTFGPSNVLSATGVLIPSQLTPGIYTIEYSGSQDGCAFSTTRLVQITENPTPEIFVNPQGPYCSNDQTPVQLIGQPFGGEFTGNGVSRDQFDNFIFTPSRAGAGAQVITYAGNFGGCRYNTTVTLTVNNPPRVEIQAVPAGPYCSTDGTPIQLTGTPPDGTFTGPGISGNTFTPSSAGPGRHTIIYAGRFEGCAFTSGNTFILEVNEPRQATLTGLEAAPYCRTDNTPKPLTGTPANGRFEGPGVVGNTFIPSRANIGENIITYSGNDRGCEFNVSVTVVIGEPQTPVITLSAGNGPFCVTQTTPIDLIATPDNGTFSGRGVVGRTFIPSQAGVGNIRIDYSGSLNGCAYQASVNVTVNQAPRVTFSTTPTGPFCSDNCNPVVLNATPANGTFSGPGVSGNTFTPCNAGAGRHVVVYSGTEGGCDYSTGSNFTIEVNNPPVAQIFFSTPGPYCASQGPITLTGFPIGGRFSGIGVRGGTFDPSQVTPNVPVDITYSGTFGGCEFSVTVQVLVNPAPSVEYVGGITQGPFCVGSTTPVPLNTNPVISGVVFSGRGVVGANFIPSQAGVGRHTITATGSVESCQVTATFSVEVSPNINATIFPLLSYCPGDQTPVTLIGTPAGGTFSGPGVSGGIFIPANAGPGTHQICYEGSRGGCSYRVCTPVIVRAAPVVSITGLADSYCISDCAIYPMTGTPAGGLFTGPAVQNNTFRPCQAVPFPRAITITYSGVFEGCPYFRDIQVDVRGAQPSQIVGLDRLYCVNAPAATISGVPANGVFTGPGISGFSFNPAAAGIGFHQINFTPAATGGECLAPTTQLVQVIDAPVVSATVPTFGVIEASATGGAGVYEFSINNGPRQLDGRFEGLSAGDYRVCARDFNGCESCTTVRITGVPPVCNCPASIEATDISIQGATVNWTPNPNATGYVVTIRLAQPGSPIIDTRNVGANVTSVLYQGLEASTEFIVNVAVNCSNGQRATTCEGRFVTFDCKVPDFFYPTIVGTGSATVEWDLVLGNEGYEIQIKPVAAGEDQWVPVPAVLLGRNVQTFTFNNLSPSTEYMSRLRTICIPNVGLSPYVYTFFTTENCEVTADIQILTVTCSTAQVQWEPVPNASGYRVNYRVAGSLGNFSTITTQTTSALLQNLTSNTGYEVNVITICQDGVTGSSPASGPPFSTADCPGVLCPAPANLAIANIERNGATISWAVVASATGYEVQFKRASEFIYGPAQVVTGTTFSLSNLDCPETYDVRVRALCPSGAGEFANVSFDLNNCGSGGDCAAPVGLIVGSVTPNSGTIVWAPVANATSYEIQVKLASDLNWSQPFITSATSFRLTNLICPNNYDVRVRAVCGANFSPYSTVALSLTDCGGGGNCPAPIFISVGNVNGASGTASVRWSRVANATAYELSWKLAASPNYNTPQIVNGTTFNLTGLVCPNVYNIRVRAICGSSFSSFMATTFDIQLCTGTGCPTPENVTVSNAVGRRATVSWNAVGSATSYQVQFKLRNSSTYGPALTVNGTSVEFTDLVCPNEYDVRVRSVCGGSFSEYTNVGFTLNDCGGGGECQQPQVFDINIDIAQQVTITWGESPNATAYEIGFKESTSANWETRIVSGTTFTLFNPACPSVYDFRVRGICGTRFSEYAVVSFVVENCNPGGGDCDAPTAPQFTLIGQGANQTLQFSWNPTNDAIFYEVQFNNGEILAVSEPTYNVDNVNCPGTHTFQVRSVCQDGVGRSAWATLNINLDECNQGACAAPLGVQFSSIEAGANQTLQFTWNATNDALFYEIQFNNGEIFASSETTYNIDGIACPGSYSFRVRSVCLDGVGRSNWTTVSVGLSNCGGTGDDCPAPGRLNATCVNSTSAVLTWGAVAQADGGYLVQWRVAGSGGAFNSANVDRNATSFNITNIVPNTVYEASIRTICEQSESLDAFTTFGPCTDTQPGDCQAPDIQVGQVTQSTVRFSWTSVIGANSYVINWKLTSEANYPVANTRTVTSTFVEVDGLEPSQTYEFRVQSICAGTGNVSPYDFEIVSTEVCGVVSGVQLLDGRPTAAIFTWLGAENATAYVVEYRETADPPNRWELADTTTNTFVEVRGLTSCKAYEVRIFSICEDGSATSPTVTDFVTTECTTLCARVTDLRTAANGITETSATITWTSSVGPDLVSYYVQYRPVDATSPWFPRFPGLFAGNTTSFTIPGLTCGTRYYAIVRAECDGDRGFSDPDTVEFTTATCGGGGDQCPCPLVTGAQAVNNTTVVINWNASTNALGYTVEYRQVNSTSSLTQDAGTATTATVSGLIANTAYEFRVIARCAAGATSSNCSWTPVSTVSGCPPVSALLVNNITPEGGFVSWRTVPNAVVYEYQVRLEGQDWGAPVTVTANNVLLERLNRCARYQVRVRSRCDQEASDWSTRNFITEGCNGCQAPDVFAVDAQRINCTSASVTWTDVSNADEFELQIRENNVSGFWNNVPLVAGTGHIFRSLMASTAYQVRLRTICANGNSDWDSLSFSTPRCVAGEGTVWQVVDGGIGWDESHSIAQTADGGYVATGYTFSWGAGEWDVYLARYNAFGDKIWDRVYGGAKRDEGRSVAVTSDGGYIVVGYTTSAPAIESDVYVIKTDANGEVEWQRTYGGNNWAIGYDVQQTADGGYIIAGTMIDNARGRDAYVLKLRSNGEVEWQNAFGGAEDDYAFGVTTTTDGGYAVTGYTQSVGAGRQDLLAMKVTNTGALAWSKAFGGTNRDFGYDVVEGANGNLVFAGYARSFGESNGDVYLVATDNNGQLAWSRTFGNRSFDFANAITATADGHYVLTGGNSENSTNATIMKVSADGELVWTNSFGTSQSGEQGRSIVQTTDGGFAIAGQSNIAVINNRNAEVYLIKTDVDGRTCSEYQTPYAVIQGSPVTVETPAQLLRTEVIAPAKNGPNQTSAPNFEVLAVCQPNDCSEMLNVTASQINSTSARIVWTGIGTVSRYELEYKRSTSANWSIAIAVSGNSYLLEALAPNTSYDVRVRAVCVRNTSFSDYVTTTLTTSGFANNCQTPIIRPIVAVDLTTTTALVRWNAIAGAQRYLLSWRLQANNTWITEVVTTNSFQIQNLTPATDYVVRVRTVCAIGDSSAFAEERTFRTLTTRNAVEQADALTNFQLYPNPSRGEVTLSFDALQAGEGDVQVFDIAGRAVFVHQLMVAQGANTQPLNLTTLSAGVYTLRLRTSEATQTFKLVIQ
jgi:hypothetical protein